MTSITTCGPASFRAAIALSALLAAGISTDAQGVTIPTVAIGNPGNSNDTTGFGTVAYDYRIGTTEVTNSQYAEFLNAKAASDPLALYNSNMGSGARGGITRSGVSGSFSYTVKTNMGDKPVNVVSWYDAIRFSNWLHNGQGTSDTETGAYTILGGTPTPSNGLSITRNPGATWWLNSENEWYKAAYHQPAAQGGDSDGYWAYPTASNSVPTIATAIDLVGPTRGDIANPGVNVANYSGGADWNGQNGNVTTVGSAGPMSESFYGTSDQGGNVFEWNETLTVDLRRGLRGGSWTGIPLYMQASHRDLSSAPNEDFNYGFRVATVPEPSSFVLAALGLIGVTVYARRRKR